MDIASVSTMVAKKCFHTALRNTIGNSGGSGGLAGNVDSLAASQNRFNENVCRELQNTVCRTRALETKVEVQGGNIAALKDDMRNHINDQTKYNLDTAVTVQNVKTRTANVEKLVEGQQSINASTSQSLANLSSSQAASMNEIQNMTETCKQLQSEIGHVAKDQLASTIANIERFSSISTDQKVLECEVKHAIRDQSKFGQLVADVNKDYRKMTETQFEYSLSTNHRIADIERKLKGVKDLTILQQQLNNAALQKLKEAIQRIDASLSKLTNDVAKIQEHLAHQKN